MRSADGKMYATDMADQESALTTLAKVARFPSLPTAQHLLPLFGNSMPYLRGMDITWHTSLY